MGSNSLCKSVYIASLNPALNESSEIAQYKYKDVPEKSSGIIFDFYTGLSSCHIPIIDVMCVEFVTNA